METTQTKVLAVDKRAREVLAVDARVHDRLYFPLLHKPLDDYCVLADDNQHVDVDDNLNIDHSSWHVLVQESHDEVTVLRHDE